MRYVMVSLVVTAYTDIIDCDRAALEQWQNHLVALSEFCDQVVAI